MDWILVMREKEVKNNSNNGFGLNTGKLEFHLMKKGKILKGVHLGEKVRSLVSDMLS